MRMRIAVLNLTSGGMSGGYRKYLRNVIPRMAAHPSIEAILCVSPAILNAEEWIGSFPNVKFLDCQPSGLMRRSVNMELEVCLRNFSPEVVFIPTECACYVDKIPHVYMVQNMEPIVGFNKGNPLSERAKNWFRAYRAKRAIKKADRVIAISKFVKEFLIVKWKISEEKIGLIYHGIDNLGRRDSIEPAHMPKDSNKDFIFTAGSIRPARGLEDIFWAMFFLRQEGKELPQLIIAGDANPNMRAYHEKLKRQIEKMGLSDRVFWAGNLGEEEMRWCYGRCSIFVMSSRVESFGQTALEAMAQGCICISAENPCLPEIFKDAAIYYPPKDSQSLAKIFKSVLSWDPGRRQRMAELAINRAAEFSWDICAKKTVEELMKACKN